MSLWIKAGLSRFDDRVGIGHVDVNHAQSQSWLTIGASTSTMAAISLIDGESPTTLVNGMIWMERGVVKVRSNGETVDL